MSDRSPRTHAPTEAVAAYREALLRHAPADELARLDDLLDPETVAWLDLFQTSRREAIRPDPAFVRRLDRVIATAPSPETSEPELAGLRRILVARSHAVNGRSPLATAQAALPARPCAPWLAARPGSAARVAATLLLLALVIGSVWAALYPHGMWHNRGVPLFAPEGTPTVVPSPDADVLLDLTLTDIPAMRAQGGMGITRYPPGGSSREQAAGSPEILFIASGPMTLTVEEAPEPVRVFAPGATGAAQPSRLVAIGEQMLLETGSAVVAPPETIVNLVNQSDGPATMLDLLWVPASNSTEAGGASWENAGSEPLDITSPVRLELRETLLDAGGKLPEPDSEAVAQAAALLDPERRIDFRSYADGSVVNAGDEPLGVYVLTVTSNAGSANASTPSPAAITSGNLESLWESEGGVEPVSRPYGLGIDPNGNLWVSDAGNDRFQILAPDGRRLETWGSPGAGEGEFEFYSPRSRYGAPYGDIAFAADGAFYVADTGNFRVQKFAPDRSFLLAWGSEGEGDGQFLAASSIAVAPDGTVYVSDENQAHIQAFDPDGRFLRSIAVPPAEPYISVPAGLTVDPGGAIWLADFGANRILRFNPAGEVLADWGIQGVRDGQLSNPNDVAVDRAGNVYVADDGNNRVQVFTPDGQFLAAIGGFTSEAAIHFNDVVAVAVSDDGTVYVSDAPTIQAFRFRTSLPPFGANPLLAS